MNSFSSFPFDKVTLQKLINILQSHPQCKTIVLQYPRKYLSYSLSISSYLKKHFNKQNQVKRQIFTLFDSMKNQCCLDLLGAEHINYELIVHFGQACFSQQYKQNHFYLFQTLTQHQQSILTHYNSQQFIQSLMNNKVGYVLAQQKLYQYIKQLLFTKLQEYGMQLLKLPYDKQQKDTYLIFGYYADCQKRNQKNKNLTNIILLSELSVQSQNKLLQSLHLCLGMISSNKQLFPSSPQIYTSSLENTQINLSELNYSKQLMSRLSQINQLDKYQTFGLLVSNAATAFCLTALDKCKILLKNANKKSFVFMMNNLNQVKLGNFPQIQVYVVISCFNKSCYNTKQFFRLVVAPIDLQIAFNSVEISQYNFDLNHPSSLQSTQVKQQTQQKQINKKIDNLQISVQAKQEIMLTNTLQTLDYYRMKQYKGLEFKQHKQVQKIRKGKIGLAESYTPLPKDQQTK